MLRRSVLLSRIIPKNRVLFSSFAHFSSDQGSGTSQAPPLLQITPAAVTQLKKIAKPGEHLRISVDSGGCSGFEYKLSIDNGSIDPNEDEVIHATQDDVSVVIDRTSLEFIKGSRLDFTTDLMRSAFRITDNPLSTQGCSCGAKIMFRGSANFRRLFHTATNSGKTLAPLAAVSWMVTIKDILGFGPTILDDDPIKDKIKQAMLHRNYSRYTEAINVLHEALKVAEERKHAESISRVYDEMANSYYEMGDLDNADKLFREVIQRLIRLHGKNEMSPEFIGISLKLADVYARKAAMEEHFKRYKIEKGANIEQKFSVDVYGPAYTDPIALFGMALEAYAYFLIDYQGEERLTEVEEYLDEVLKISYHIYGVHDPHSTTLLNNMGTKLLLKNRFKLARKYLEVGIDRILFQASLTPMIVAYYTAYAEALYHTGDPELALEYALKAEKFAQSMDPHVKSYAEKFRRDMEKDTRALGVKRKQVLQSVEGTGNKSKDDSEQNSVSGWRRWIPI
ncbi:iron-sulfur cluster biosynthesis domain-containing protein [Ditylenchus destructor]|uniref:Iron-sulfur cluster biosynthesis domain-containing protein n=1 Tax=Ditylenchus destructor TaxID=166010 RepID=A0AAD4R609_9BILA|nr:iron-sulfur cluster biosynthesis domain-containing protein [Ditylenchus destructor]